MTGAALSRREKARIRRRARREHLGKFLRAVAVSIGVGAVLISVVSSAGLSNSWWSSAVYSVVGVAPPMLALIWFDSRYVDPELERAERAAAGGPG